jgi:hypothetical protein
MLLEPETPADDRRQVSPPSRPLSDEIYARVPLTISIVFHPPLTSFVSSSSGRRGPCHRQPPDTAVRRKRSPNVGELPPSRADPFPAASKIGFDLDVGSRCRGGDHGAPMGAPDAPGSP